MTFRYANPDDLPTLNKISHAAKQYWGYPQEWMNRWKEDLTITPQDLDYHHVIVGEKEEVPAGVCVIAEFPSCYEILHLWVLPEMMGKGVGKSLLAHALDLCVNTEKPIMVESEPHAEKFYQKQGFETIDQVESYPPGRYLPIMKKRQNSGT